MPLSLRKLSVEIKDLTHLFFSARFNSTVKDHGGTYDTIYDDVQIEKGESRRAFTYLTLGGARFLYATGARLAAMKFVASWSASADVLALASMEVDISKIDPASCVTVKWRGKPVFIRSRTEEEIAEAVNVDMSELKDPETVVTSQLPSFAPCPVIFMDTAFTPEAEQMKTSKATMCHTRNIFGNFI